MKKNTHTHTHIYICITESLCSTLEIKHIISQLYFNKNFLKRIRRLRVAIGNIDSVNVIAKGHVLQPD